MPLCKSINTFARFSRLFNAEVKRMQLKEKDTETGSLIELLNFPRSQSIMSRLGFALEKTFNRFLESTKGVKILNSKRDVALYGHQLDLLFKYKKTIYYFELKSNLNLDTEKSKSVVKKIQKLKRLLQAKYPKNKIVSVALSARYDRKEEIKHIKRPINANIHLYGYADFFDIFGVCTTKGRWEAMFKRIGETIRNRQ